MTARKDLHVAHVLGLAHGAVTIEGVDLADPATPDLSVVSEFRGSMLQSATPIPKSSIDRVFDALLGRGGATGAGVVSRAQPYRPFRKRKRRQVSPARDAAILVNSKRWYRAAVAVDGRLNAAKDFAAETLRIHGGAIRGRNRKHRVFRMAALLDRGAP